MIDTHMSPLPSARILMDTFQQRMTDGAASRLQEGTGAKYPGCWTIHCLCWCCSVVLVQYSTVLYWTIHCLCWYRSVAMQSTCHITVGLQRRSASHRQILSVVETLTFFCKNDVVITIILVTVKWKWGIKFWVPISAHAPYNLQMQERHWPGQARGGWTHVHSCV